MKATEKKGLVVHWFDARKGVRNIRTELVFGFILNTRGWLGKHWSAVRMLHDEWLNLDSKLSRPVKFESKDAVRLFFFFFSFSSHFNRFFEQVMKYFEEQIHLKGAELFLVTTKDTDSDKLYILPNEEGHLPTRESQ